MTRGLVLECTEVEISVTKVCLPISFKLYSDAEISFNFEFNTGLKVINIEKQLELNSTAGCPISSFSIS